MEKFDQSKKVYRAGQKGAAMLFVSLTKEDTDVIRVGPGPGAPVETRGGMLEEAPPNGSVLNSGAGFIR